MFATPVPRDGQLEHPSHQKAGRSYLDFQAVVFHCKVTSRRSNVKGDPLSSVEGDLEGRVHYEEPTRFNH